MYLKITQNVLRSFCIKFFALALVLFSLNQNATAQTFLLNEGFTTVPPAGWTIKNNSTPVGTLSWIQGNTANWTAFDGPDDSYAFVNYNSVAGANTISNWMISPQLTGIKNGDIVSFYTRTFTNSDFPDRSQLRLSTNGASTDVGTTATSVGDFTVLLSDVNATLTVGGYPEIWTKFTATISGLTGVVNGRIALRYFVEDGGPAGNNSNGVGFDRVQYQSLTTCSGTPAPGSTFSTSSVVCPGTSITLSPQFTTPGDDVTYQWQTGTSATGPWTNVTTGGVASTYTTTPTTSTFYRVQVTCVAATTPTTPIEVRVTACTCITPDLSTICSGAIQKLMVTLPPVTTLSFTNSTLITIGTGAGAPGSVYPSTLSVTGVPLGSRVKSVTINGITHSWPADIDIALVSPTNTPVILMSDVAGITPIANYAYTFDDAAATALTTAAAPQGTYKPSNSGTPDNFVAPGPGSLTQATPTLSSFTGNMNGTWNLFMVDDATGDGGSIGGFSITFEVPFPTAVWTGGTFYTDAAATVPYVAGTETNAVYVKPTATTTYTATIASGSCAGANNVTVNVLPIPVVTLNTTSGCGPLTLTASGADNYSWSPATGLNTTNGATVIANPATSTTYTVIGTNANGCSSVPVNATVNSAPTGSVISAVSAPTYQINEDFAVVTPAGPAGWATQNLSAPVGLTGWFQGNTTVFPSFDGAPTAYIAANFNNTGANGTISNWLFTPTVNIKNGDIVSFYTRAAASVANRAERLQLRMSLNGNSTNVGNTATSVGDFTATLIEVNPNLLPGVPNYPETWTKYSATITGITGTVSGKFAFRYFVTGGGNPGTNSNFIGIDRVQYGTAPTGLNCANVVTNLKVDITGGVGPYTLVYGNGTSNTTINGYVSGSNIQVSPAVTTTYTVVSITGANGCVGSGNTGSAVIAITPPPSITTSPASKGVCDGNNTTFTVVAAPATGNTYQWQVSTDAGVTYTNLTNTGIYSGTTTSTLIITGVTSAINNYRYRALVTGACPPAVVTSAAATLTVNTPAVITVQPVNASICAGTSLTGTTAKYSVTATGGGLTYQWQVSTNNGTTFTNIAATNTNYTGATTNTLTVMNVTAAFATNVYRVNVTSGGCTAVSSATVTLTVNPTPVLVVSASPYTAIYPGQTTTLVVAVSPNPGTTYTWFKNGVAVPGATTNTLAGLTVDDLGSYTVRVTNTNGCTALSAATVISSSANDLLFIYPSPNTGQFQVRYYNRLGASPFTRTVNVYDNKGSRVYTKVYSITSPYTRMDVDLKNHAKGIYNVELVDYRGNRMKTGRVLVL